MIIMLMIIEMMTITIIIMIIVINNANDIVHETVNNKSKGSLCSSLMCL